MLSPQIGIRAALFVESIPASNQQTAAKSVSGDSEAAEPQSEAEETASERAESAPEASESATESASEAAESASQAKATAPLAASEAEAPKAVPGRHLNFDLFPFAFNRH